MYSLIAGVVCFCKSYSVGYLLPSQSATQASPHPNIKLNLSDCWVTSHVYSFYHTFSNTASLWWSKSLDTVPIASSLWTLPCSNVGGREYIKNEFSFSMDP